MCVLEDRSRLPLHLSLRTRPHRMLLLAVAATLSLLPENNQRRQISSELNQTRASKWTDIDAVSNNDVPDMLVVFRVSETASVLLHADISSVGPKAMLRLLVDGKSVSTVIVGQKEQSKAGRYQSVSFHGAIANLAAGTHQARVQFLSLSNKFRFNDETSEDTVDFARAGNFLEPTTFPAPFHATAGETRLVVREVANSRFASQVAPGYDAGANTQRITCAFNDVDAAQGYSYDEGGGMGGSYGAGISTNRNTDDDACDYVDLFGTAVDFYPQAGTSKALITVDLGWILMCAALCPLEPASPSSYLCSHLRMLMLMFVSFACICDYLIPCTQRLCAGSMPASFVASKWAQSTPPARLL